MARKMRDIMSPAPVSLAATETAATAARAMKEHGTGTVLVSTGGEFTGLVTERDITVRVLAEEPRPAVHLHRRHLQHQAGRARSR